MCWFLITLGKRTRSVLGPKDLHDVDFTSLEAYSPGPLVSIQAGLFKVPQALSHLRLFTLACPSIWNALFQGWPPLIRMLHLQLCLLQLSYLTRSLPAFHKPIPISVFSSNFVSLECCHSSFSFLFIACLLHLVISSMRSGTICLWDSWSWTESVHTVGIQQLIFEWIHVPGGFMMIKVPRIVFIVFNVAG